MAGHPVQPGVDPRPIALEATRRIRHSAGMRHLPVAEKAALDRDLDRLERALRNEHDPYSLAQATPADLQRDLGSHQGWSGQGSENAGRAGASNGQTGQAATPPPGALDRFGERAGAAIESIDFPGFVSSLIAGTFQAIVDATAQQVREYAQLVSSIAQSVDDFASDNVTPDQTRQWLAERYPADLRVDAPGPGQPGGLRLMPRGTGSASPAWLREFDLDGRDLDDELTEGALLSAGRLRLAENRMQSLATMVLMGINRVVVDQGNIRARMQFHAAAREQTQAEVTAMQASRGIAGRQIRSQNAASMMVSTVKANVQADANLKADLMGEVSIQFRTETFPLERFADSAAIQLINRHARWNSETPAGAASSGNGSSESGTGNGSSGNGTGNSRENA